MNRFIIAPLGLLSIFVAVATGCAVEATSYETSDSELTSERVRMVGIEGDGSERESIANESPFAEHNGNTARVPQPRCIGCGPLPDPWKNGPLPDPWTERSNGGSGSGSGSGSADNDGTGSNSGNNGGHK